jgi:hypothetical protein
LIPFPKFFFGLSTFLPDVKIVSNPDNEKKATLNACIKFMILRCELFFQLGKFVLAFINIKTNANKINNPHAPHLTIPLHFEIFLKYFIPTIFKSIIPENTTIPIRSRYKFVNAPQSCTINGID